MTQKSTDAETRRIAELSEESEGDMVVRLWQNYARGDTSLEDFNTIMRLNFPTDLKRPTSH